MFATQGYLVFALLASVYPSTLVAYPSFLSPKASSPPILQGLDRKELPELRPVAWEALCYYLGGLDA